MFFKLAKPSFIENESMNTHIVLKADVRVDSTLFITACSFYRVYVNGIFIAYGPARAAKGYYRVDIIDIPKGNLEIEVVSYHNKSLSTCYGDGFVCAEISSFGIVTHYTPDSFDAYIDSKFVTKVERYSGQRHFGEVYEYGNTDTKVDLIVKKEPKYLDRVVPYPDYSKVILCNAFRIGTFTFNESKITDETKNNYSFSLDNKYDEKEIKYFPYRFVRALELHHRNSNVPLQRKVYENEYYSFDFMMIKCGFINFKMFAASGSEIVIAFSEVKYDDDFNLCNKLRCQTVIGIKVLKDMNIDEISFEPYSFRYACVFVKKGSIILDSIGCVNYIHNKENLVNHNIDIKYKPLYNAALNTFLANALDIYTDCPSRERAGWLCDSYFTAKAEYFFFKESKVEEAYLENYLLYENDGLIPKGMIPMCYPSDITSNHSFIPQWSLWFILEVYDYFTNRNGKKLTKEKFKEKIYGILDFFKEYENEFFLPENLPGWNFVEWSVANDWTNDVSYPTAFLYSEALEESGKLYSDQALIDKAKIVRNNAMAAFDGIKFRDHAVRIDGKLQVLNDSSEASQYYAFLFGNLDLNNLKDFKENLVDGFSKCNIFKVDAFIGFYLRIESLLKLQEYEALDKDIISFFNKMIAESNTLWEHRDGIKSRNHGFASYIAYVLEKSSKNN